MSTKVPFVSVLNLLNGVQFLNTTCVAAVSGCFLWGSSPAAAAAAAAAAIVLVTVIFPVTKIYASE